MTLPFGEGLGGVDTIASVANNGGSSSGPPAPCPWPTSRFSTPCH